MTHQRGHSQREMRTQVGYSERVTDDVKNSQRSFQHQVRRTIRSAAPFLSVVLVNLSKMMMDDHFVLKIVNDLNTIKSFEIVVVECKALVSSIHQNNAFLVTRTNDYIT